MCGLADLLFFLFFFLTCHPTSTDCLEGVLVCGLADRLGEPVVLSDEVGRCDPDRFQRRCIGEVEDLVQVGADLEQLAGQQRVDVETLPLGLSRQLRDDARTGQAEVEGRETVRRVETASEPARTVTAAGVKTLRLVPVGNDPFKPFAWFR